MDATSDALPAGDTYRDVYQACHRWLMANDADYSIGHRKWMTKINNEKSSKAERIAADKLKRAGINPNSKTNK